MSHVYSNGDYHACLRVKYNNVSMHTAIIAITKLYITIGIINSDDIIAIFKGDLGLPKRVAIITVVDL